MKSSLLTIVTILFFFIGCEKKIEPVKVGEMNEYKDPAYGFKIKYPKEWKNFGQAGKAIFAKSQEVLNKFIDPRTGEEGAQVTVEVIRYFGKTPDEILNEGKENLKETWQNIQVMPDAPLAVAGKQATNVRYSIPVTSKTMIQGLELYIPGDTAMYKLTQMGYGDHYGAHGDVFNAIINSFELPAFVAKKSDVWAPSGNMETYKTDFFTMQYPDNLDFVQTKKGANYLAMGMRADRLDCSINIDVFDAKKLSVEKVWDQNKGKYKVKSSGQAKIDDQNAFFADYSPMRDINSRVYFAVKNDKVIRVTINYFAPQKDVYFPTFENMVKSIKLK